VLLNISANNSVEL